VISDLLRGFERAIVLEIRRNAGRAEGVIADFGLIPASAARR
jgi:hypothetical protein